MNNYNKNLYPKIWRKSSLGSYPYELEDISISGSDRIGECFEFLMWWKDRIDELVAGKGGLGTEDWYHLCDREAMWNMLFEKCKDVAGELNREIPYDFKYSIPEDIKDRITEDLHERVEAMCFIFFWSAAGVNMEEVLEACELS